MMRVISFCADGIRRAAKAGFYTWLREQDADFVCIQNLRAREDQLSHPVFHPEGYYAYFFDAADGKNGVAIYSRHLPKAIMTGLGLSSDGEARYIQADFANLSVASLLPPVAESREGDDFERRLQFLDHWQSLLDKVRNKRRRYILCAALGIAHQASDLQHPEAAANQPGCSAEERTWLDALTGSLDYVDAFRRVTTDSDEFTWQRENADGSTSGWRSDYQFVSGELAPRIEYGMIYKKQAFGSHAPLIIDYDIDLET